MILQFDAASVTTVGLIIGLMFVAAGVQNLVFASLSGSTRWVAAVFGVLFLIAGTICFISPGDTFAALADVLGFLFVLVGVWWMIRSFLEIAVTPFWWLGLIAGVLMTVLGFWTAGQFFIEKAFVLLVFAGIWALMEGITDIVRAFQVREFHEQLSDER